MTRQNTKAKGKASGALATLTRELAALPGKDVGELRNLYRELHGEPTRSHNKPWLVKRCAWLMQARANGGLESMTIGRIAELGDKLPQAWTAKLATPVTVESSEPQRDPRLPPVGHVLTREHGGKSHAVTILVDGVEYQGERFKSLSEVATAIAGTRWNGFRFFGLNSK